MSYIDKTFSSGGYLARAQKNYEVRQGQIELARQVHTAMVKGDMLLAEAPCGSGKGFAYAVPAIEEVQRHHKTVIVTANIALQAQLIEKDFPALANALPHRKFRVALLKGRSNFLCPRKVDQVDLTRKIMGLDTAAYQNYGLGEERGRLMRAALAWADVTSTGDREDPGFPTDAEEIWHLISVGQDECIGRGCPFEQQGVCFANNHRREALKADIIVTNYHLLYAHAKIFQRSKSNILPNIDHLVMDEAHEAARIAREFFGARISYPRFKRIAELVKHELHQDARTITEAGRWLMGAVGALADTIEYRSKRRLDQADLIDIEDVVAALRDATDSARAMADGICAEDSGDYNKLSGDEMELYHKARMVERNAQSLAQDVNEVFHEPQADKVYWIQIEKKRPIRVETRHLDVADVFQTSVRPLSKSMTLTSATLTTTGTFDLIRGELGIPDNATTFIADSPFSFSENARLVVASKSCLAPASENREAFNRAVLPLYQQVFDLWPGRVLCLFTALGDLDWMHERLDGYQGRTFYKQGEFPRPLLTQYFRDDPGSILMGVDSFWTGVDVPGPKAIIIHKLPFPYQDVVLKAIAARMSKEEWFKGRYYPWMLMRLRQGVGRLLRRTGDYGFVVCMDRRMTDKWAYSDLIRRSLPFPGFLRTDQLHQLQPFLQNYANAQAIAV